MPNNTGFVTLSHCHIIIIWRLLINPVACYMVEKKGGPVPRQKFNLPSPRPQPSTSAAPARGPQTRLRRSSPAFAQPGAPAQHPGGPSPVPPNAAPKVQPGTHAGPPQVFNFCQLSPVPESIGFI